MTTSLTTRQSSSLDVWGADFEETQRRVKAITSSPIWPKAYQDVGSGLIIFEMAMRIGMSPLEVAQNVHIVHGVPSWKSSYIIQKIAETYDSFEYVERVAGKVQADGKAIDNVCLKIVATRDGKAYEGEEVSYEMAITEGWWSRSGSKWKTMPRQMLTYRAAAFFNRKWPMSNTFGIRPEDEVEDIEAVVVQPVTATPPTPRAKKDVPPIVQEAPPIVQQAPPAPPAQVKMTTHEIVNLPADTGDDENWAEQL